MASYSSSTRRSVLGDRDGSGGIEPRERIERFMQELAHDATEMLDLTIAVGRAFLGSQARADVADLLGLIADALKVRDRLDHRDDQPQVRGSGATGCQDAAAVLVDRHFHGVDLGIAVGDLLAQTAVPLHERFDGEPQLLLDEPAHLQHVRTHPLQVVVEAAQDVV